jgi:hypothetical protein
MLEWLKKFFTKTPIAKAEKETDEAILSAELVFGPEPKQDTEDSGIYTNPAEAPTPVTTPAPAPVPAPVPVEAPASPPGPDRTSVV